MAEADGLGLRRFLAHALVIAGKDLRTELRSKEILVTMGFFGFLVVLVFSFTFFRGDAPLAVVSAGILWVAIAFSGTLGLARAFEREREADAIRALLLLPIARSSIYLGKMLGILAFMILVELIVVPAVGFFFNLPLLEPARLGPLVTVLVLGTIGYAAIGTLLSAALMKAHAKEVLLAVVIYPFIVPVLIAGTKATAAILEPTVLTLEVESWVRILLFYDTVFFVLSMWVFEALILD